MGMPSNKLIETKDLIFIWKLISKNIGVLLIIPIIAYLIGFIYTYRLTETYASRTELLLKSNETYDYQDPIYKGLGAYGAYSDVLNQIKILKSRDLIAEVVEKIDVNTSYFIVGRLKKHEVYKTLPFISRTTILNKNVYEIPIQIQVVDQNKFNIKYELEGKFISEQGFFDTELLLPDFSILLERRYTFNEENIEVIKESEYELIFHSDDYLVSKYQRNLKIENEDYTSVLVVEVTDELEYRAKTFLDTLNSVFVEYSTRSQLEVNEKTLQNIEKQIDTIESFIQNKEEELLLFKDQNAILHLSKEEDDFFVQYVASQQQKREVEYRKSLVIELEEYVKNSSDEHILPPSSSLLESDAYLRKSIEEIYSMQLEIINKGFSQFNTNMHIQTLQDKISKLKRDVLVYIKNLKNSIESQLKIVNNEIAYYKENIRKLPRTSQGVENINRELEVNNKMYLFLLEKKINTLIARAGIIPQVQIIESPRSLGVIAPDRTKMLRLFVLGGFIFAILIATFRKIFFEKIENVSELSVLTGVTIAGGVPFVKDEFQNKIVVQTNPKSQATESFRTIRSNLNYLGTRQNGRAKKILVSSYYPGEGKTFCSTNIAALMAKGDQRVLILDFDLHKPKIHKTFGIDNKLGISSYLIGKANVKEIIQKDIHTGLDIITAGPIPPNPSELILKSTVLDLLSWAEVNYDLIIIDTPPFGLLNDAVELVDKVDVFFVILNTKLARRRGVLFIEEMLSKYKNIDKALILNGIKLSRFQYYYSKYTYKYSYGYGRYGYGYGNYGESYDSTDE